MALVDFIDRVLSVRVGGRNFALHPISVVGMIAAQRIIGSAVVEAGTGNGGDPMSRLLEAVQSGGDVKAAMSELYLSAIDTLGRARFAKILALLSADGKSDYIFREVLDEEPAAAAEAFVQAIAELHDLTRLMNIFTPREGSAGMVMPSVVADSDGIGLETVVLDVAMELSQYTFSDILEWPYERMLSVQEQIVILRNLRAGRATRDESKPSIAETPGRLAAAGLHVQVKPKSGSGNSGGKVTH